MRIEIFSQVISSELNFLSKGFLDEVVSHGYSITLIVDLCKKWPIQDFSVAALEKRDLCMRLAQCTIKYANEKD